MELNELRQQIDVIDKELINLFCKRMEISGQIAEYKKEHALPVYIPEREAEKLASISLMAGSDMADYTQCLFKQIFKLSKDYQSKLI